MNGVLFDLAFWLVAPVWLLMVFVPAWHWTERIAGSPLTVVPILVLWAFVAFPVFPDLWAAVSNPELGKFQDLIELSGGAAALWAQILAWDLLVGQWMYREGRRLAVHPLVMGPLLVFTIFLSPLGLPLFLLLRAVLKARSTAGPAGSAQDGEGRRPMQAMPS